MGSVSKKTVSGIIFLAICLILSMGTFAHVAYAEDEATPSGSREIKVGWFFSNDEEGSYADYSHEYLEAVAQQAGWHYTFVNGTFSECLQWCEDGTVDLMPYTLKTDEREQYLNYADLPEGTEKMYLVTSESNDRFSYEDYASFDGMVVATMNGDANTDYFRAFAAKKNFSVQIVTYPDYQSMFDAVNAGEADAFISGDYQGTGTYKLLAKFGEQPFYFVATKTKPELIGELNGAMSFIDLNYPDFQSDLTARYGVYQNQMTELSADEKAYLETSPTLIACLRSDRNPLAYKDSESEDFKGIVPDVLDYAIGSSGINIQYQNFSAESFRERNAVIVCPYDFNWADEHDLCITAPFATVSIVRVSQNSSSESTVAHLVDDYLTYDVYDQLPDDVNVVDYDSVQDCMDAVRSGEADCVYLSSYEAGYYSQIPRYNVLTFETLSDITQQVSFGMSNASDPELVSIVEKYVGTIDTEEIRAIVSDDSRMVYSESLTDVFYHSPMVGVIAALVLGVILIGMVVLAMLYRRKSRQAAEANAAKSEFLSRISHDMRTPMNGIMGMTRIAAEQDNPPKTVDCLEKIDTSSKFLLGLINNVLDMSKAEEGKIRLDIEPYRFELFSDYLEAVIKPACDEKGIEFAIEPHLALGYVPLMDRQRTDQIVLNLLSNAVKFTSSGGKITLEVDERLVDSGHMEIKAKVADTGIGISEKFLPHLFEPFAQEQRNDISESRGTGLGLPIVKQLVEKMNGTIEVQSKMGEGSAFILRGIVECVPEDKPWARRADATRAADVTDDEADARDARLAGLNVLLCEDHPLNQEITRLLLEKKGMRVDIAENGRRAVEEFSASEPGFFNVILMDIRMPLMDGYEATGALRALDRVDAKRVPIVALTADASAEDVRKCMDTGMNGHIAKPIDAQIFFETIEDVV